MLRATVNEMKQRLDALESAQVQSPATSHFHDQCNRLTH